MSWRALVKWGVSNAKLCIVIFATNVSLATTVQAGEEQYCPFGNCPTTEVLYCVTGYRPTTKSYCIMNVPAKIDYYCTCYQRDLNIGKQPGRGTTPQVVRSRGIVSARPEGKLRKNATGIEPRKRPTKRGPSTRRRSRGSRTGR